MFSVFRGLLLENFIISDFHKQSYNLGIEPSLYYWRDQNERIEVDCLIDLGISIRILYLRILKKLLTAQYF